MIEAERGRKQIRGVSIITPGKPKAKDTPCQKRQKRNKCRARAAIEPMFGHLKRTSVWNRITCDLKKAYKSTLIWLQLPGT
ncbi:hypothetical protein JCM10003_962 [Bacteroides pyogenes JCM 10003]|nr:hypothetical protein JCM10003_962 [Bacteroides pyogenes JCM 10003]